jgi:hypothetical protein
MLKDTPRTKEDTYWTGRKSARMTWILQQKNTDEILEKPHLDPTLSPSPDTRAGNYSITKSNSLDYKSKKCTKLHMHQPPRITGFATIKSDPPPNEKSIGMVFKKHPLSYGQQNAAGWSNTLQKYAVLENL